MWSSPTRHFPKKIPCNRKKCLVTVQRLIGTLLTKIFFDVFLLFYANLTLSLCWYLKFLFLFYFWNLMLFPDIKTWKTYNQSCVFIIFRVYLCLLNSSANNISCFVSYLLNFCYCRSVIFATAPPLASLRFFVSLLITLNMFCTLFYWHHHWMG